MTIKFVWYPNGVMNAAEAASMIPNDMRTTSIPPFSAAPMAMGKIKAAAALLAII